MTKKKPIEVNEQFIKDMEEYRKPCSDSLLESCAVSPVVFADKMLDFRLYAWQVYFLERIRKRMDKTDTADLNREFAALTSRQIGKSTAVAIFSLWACIFNKYPGTVHTNTVVGITSASDVQAKKLLYEMKKFLMTGDRVMKDKYGKDEFFKQLLAANEPNNTTTITFTSWQEGFGLLLKGSKSGSVIKSYPPTSVVLGETFTITIIDEAGKTDKISDEFYYDYIYPTGNSTDAVRINTSTPWVSSGFFYQMTDPDGINGNTATETVIFTIDAIKIENPPYYANVMNIINQMNKDGKQNEVQRAYYCRFVQGETSYFNPERVREVFTDEYDMTEGSVKPCDMGVDFGGKVASRTVITISYIDDNGIIRRLYHRRYDVGEDETLLDDIAELYTRFNVQRLVPDDCPAGDYLIRRMQEKGWEVHPMNFRTDKVKRYGAFRTAINKNTVKSYIDNDLKTEMLALEHAHGRRQSVIEHAPGYTDDLIDSFVMSCYFFLDVDEGPKFFNMDAPVKKVDGACDACGSKKFKQLNDTQNECKECGYIWKR